MTESENEQTTDATLSESKVIKVNFDEKRKAKDALDEILDSFERFCSRG